jgi:hypothetical protein
LPDPLFLKFPNSAWK